MFHTLRSSKTRFIALARLIAASLITAGLTTPVLADIEIRDAYARASSPKAKAGAAFMMIANTGNTADRLIAAQSTIAVRTELHTHREISEGVMRMVQLEDGIDVPAGGTAHLVRGGNHVMFMGLNQSLTDGSVISVTLEFEHAGKQTIDIPVDLHRRPQAGAHGSH